MSLRMVLLVVGLASLVNCAPAIDRKNSQVLHYEMNTDYMPNYYKYSYDTSDGSSRSEEGQINDPNTVNAALDVLGTTRWITDDGAVYEMSYKAGKRGYRTIIRKLS